MVSLVMDAIVSVLARIVAIAVILILLAVAGLPALLLASLFTTVASLVPETGIPYVTVGGDAWVSFQPGPAPRILIGPPLALLLVVVHAVLSAIASAAAEEGDSPRSLLRSTVSAALSPIFLALAMALSNVAVAVTAGLVSPAQQTVSGVWSDAVLWGQAVFVLSTMTMVLVTANVVSFQTGVVAAVGLLVFCVLYALMAGLLVLFRLLSVLYGAALHIVVLMGFVAGPAQGAGESGLRSGMILRVVEAISRTAVVRLSLQVVLTVAVALSIAGGLVQNTLWGMMDAYYATARGLSQTNYGLLKATGQAAEGVFAAIYPQRQPPRQAPEACSLSGGDGSCDALIMRAALTGMVGGLVFVGLLFLFWSAVREAVLGAWEQARVRASQWRSRLRGWMSPVAGSLGVLVGPVSKDGGAK
ncbi:hypothetical protein [Thermoflexus sp.]|jgi:hypothetical protein|uniref:hypothetical protein n=1 Tax=Thermoflexus sp. TaxID=1969742 RepID=UPI003C069FA8